MILDWGADVKAVWEPCIGKGARDEDLLDNCGKNAPLPYLTKNTALRLIVKSTFDLPWPESGHIEALKLLLDHGAGIDSSILDYLRSEDCLLKPDARKVSEVNFFSKLKL